MKQSLLYPLFKKLRPKAAQLDDQHALQSFVEFFTVVYLTPFALVGLVWLLVVSDFTLVYGGWLEFVILFLGLLIIESRPASIPLRLGENTSTSITITLGSILLWAGLFIWGPIALAIDLGVVILLRLHTAWQLSRSNQDFRWSMLAFGLQEISYTTLANLIGISIYLALGGKTPLVGDNLEAWIPALIAIVINAFVPAMILLPVFMQINRLAKVPNTWSSIRSFLWTVVGVILITTPFAIPFALLYARVSPLAGMFAMLGLVLVNLLLYYLSRINQSSRQRTREMTQLEALGEEIIQAPPDGSTLRELLFRHVERMFQDSRDILEIRIFDDINLPGFAGGAKSLNLVVPSHQSALPASHWHELRSTKNPHLIFRNVVPPGAKTAYGDAILDKITSAAPTENGTEPVCIGGVYLLRHKSVAHSVDSLPAVQALASQVASALYRAQVYTETLLAHKMSQELEFAGSIQASFLPEHVPDVAGWEIAASLTPARQTAGDFYDFIMLGEDKLGIVVADVADKGTGAALYMALSRTLIRTYAMQFPDDPAEALRQANERILADTRANQFVTVFYGVVDLASGEMLYANAGHNPVYLFRKSNPERYETFIRTGPPMGIFGDLVWEEGSAKVNPGDLLLLYTDGVNEVQNTAEEFYDYDRLLREVNSHLALSAKAVHDAIINSVQTFVGQAPQFDDITLMILKRD